ncbi:hypothetical protein ABZW30_36265 [Kitasatospora sp. NPDC004669]|uniref:hypothetical protein n=1 Tax=Kitasatospora sp. NPDC004669 TaxID=3154555 RepID=UPI0033AB4DE6
MWDDLWGGRGHRSTLRRCRRIAERLELPRPFDPAVLLERLAARRGRPQFALYRRLTSAPP